MENLMAAEILMPVIENQEQGPPSKFASGLRPAPEIWATATRSRAPVFTSALRGAPEKPAKRKRIEP